MPNTSDMKWFKTNFQDKINPAIAGTPWTIDLMTALACQETGEVWPTLRKTDLSLDRILELCVGDTIDFNPTTGKGRHAFPKNKAELIAFPKGQQMFDLARQALLDMAHFIPSYQDAASKPNKFCHGYGIFQFDLQFFKQEPDYFLEKRYANFDECLKKAISELEAARKRIGLQNKPQLSDEELCHIAIAYNTGGFNPARGLKQGFAPRDKHGNVIGPFYGEQILGFIQKSKTVSADSAPATPTSPGPDTRPRFKVTASTLNLRSEALIDQNDPQSNVKAKLPQGQQVRAVTGQPVNGFLEVETDFQGQHLRGFASAKFLTRV
jgi:hypothetical protein